MKIFQLLTHRTYTQWLIFALASILYVNTLPNKWAIDDRIIIYQNKFVQKGVNGIVEIFSHDAFAGFYGKDVPTIAGGRYRPLTPSIFALQAEVFASTKQNEYQEIETNKQGYKLKNLDSDTWFPHILHIFNALWYGLLCVMIYKTLFLLIFLKKPEDTASTHFIAFSTTLLYTVHPIHTEVVANVKGLDEILSMLGCVSSLYCLLKAHQLDAIEAVKGQKNKWWIAAVGIFSAALFAKETAITFIAVIPLAFYFFTSAPLKKIAIYAATLFVPFLMFMGVRSAVLHTDTKPHITKELMNDPFLVLDPAAQYAPLIQGSSIQKLINPNSRTYYKMPYSNQLATNAQTWGKYLQLMVVPYPLTIDYYPRQIAIASITDVGVILSLLIHLLFLIWAIYQTPKKNPIAFGILYYFITFSIVSNLFFPIGTHMAERFMFMPSLGFCFAVVYGVYSLALKQVKTLAQQKSTFLYVTFAVISLVFSGITFSRNFDWKDNFTLFSTDIKTSTKSGKLPIDLAGELIFAANEIKLKEEETLKTHTLDEQKSIVQQQDKQRETMYVQAIALLEKALTIHPLGNSAWFLMGNAQLALGQIETHTPNQNLTYLYTAKAAYELADAYKANGTEAIINLQSSICHNELGKIVGQQFGDIATAITLFEKSQKLDPKNAETYLLLGTAHSVLKNYDKAIEFTQKSLSLRPKDLDTKKNLAVAYQQSAFENPAKRENLITAEKLLLEVYAEEKKFTDETIINKEAMMRSWELLFKNYTLQGNTEKAAAYNQLLLSLSKPSHN